MKHSEIEIREIREISLCTIWNPEKNVIRVISLGAWCAELNNYVRLATNQESNFLVRTDLFLVYINHFAQKILTIAI